MRDLLFYPLNYLHLFVIVSFFLCARGIHRELTYEVNPGCDIPECDFRSSNQSHLNVVHVTAKGPNDTVHYLWSTYLLPSIIIAQTTHSATLKIDWSKLIKQEDEALNFTESPVQSFGLILTQILTFIDDDDKVRIPDSRNLTHALNLTDFNWASVNSSIKFSAPILSAVVSATSEDPVFSSGGSFKIQFSTSGITETSSNYPHLRFNSNCTEMKIQLDNLAIDKKGRFAVEFMAVSNSTWQGDWNHAVTSSINDEYSPGVFKTHTLHPCETCEIKSFLSWKPVAYIGQKATVANSSDAVISFLTPPATMPPSLVSMYFSGVNNLQNVSWTMTFGTSGDGFYDKTKYTSWLVMVGTGEPVVQKLSQLAKIIIGIGLGAPCVIVIIGGLYLVYKKYRKDDDDDLLLDE